MKRSLPVIRPKELIRVSERAGFYVHHVSGSHYVLKHAASPMLRVTVPFHNRDFEAWNASIDRKTGRTYE